MEEAEESERLRTEEEDAQLLAKIEEELKWIEMQQVVHTPYAFAQLPWSAPAMKWPKRSGCRSAGVARV